MIESPWQVRTLKDAYQPRPPTQYVVDKFFATESLSVVYGAPGVMKSMILADLCTCIASGMDWLPGVFGARQGIQVEVSPVLWVDMDNGNRRSDERFEALGRGRKLNEDAPIYYISMPNPPIMLNDLDSLIELMKLVNQVEARFLVLDNLGLITGDVEENSAGMAQIMGNLRTIAERTKAAVCVVHHQRKGGASGSRRGDGLRGHSSIEAALDLALHIVREPDSHDVTITSTKTRGVDVPMVTASFNYTHRPGTNDLETAWFSGKAEVRGSNPIRETIVKILMEYEDGMIKGRLVDAVHEHLNGEYGVLKIRNWVQDMIAVSGDLEENRSGENNAKVITLA